MLLRGLLCGTFLLIGVTGMFLALRDDPSDDVWRHQPALAELNSAAGRSPWNPRLGATVGRYYALDPDIQNFPKSERELQRVIALAPADYRLWLALGETLSLEGKLAEAETACRRALALAPNHFDPQWQMANILFRQGKLAEAAPFARRSIALDEESSPLMLDLGWQISNGDQAFVTSLLPESPAVQLQYLKLLTAKQRTADAVTRWKQLPAGTQTELATSAREFVRQLIEQKEFASAWEVWATLPEQRASKPVRGAVQDGGFQAKPSPDACFEWKYAQPEVGARLRIDPVGPEGRGGALKIVYESEGQAFEHARQLILVGDGRYRLTYFTRSNQLASGSPPVVEVRQASAPQGWRVRSSPSMIGSQTWTRNELEFAAPAGVNAVEIVIYRPSECSTGGQCAIVGTAWFGGFSLEPATSTPADRSKP